MVAERKKGPLSLVRCEEGCEPIDPDPPMDELRDSLL